ncbi:molecular chaperone [Dechloromonas sp. H13]|uniref:TorD/DmsD family molecular chaperone n=1 Tax=Dechloromonas sp. H13 TaxID=2570193 RepID=UPI0018856202|nr:molecular chaperone TorD family protein [Dechloromonas sp. H13]
MTTMQAELRAALADDLDQLVRLHDRELDGDTIAALKAADFPHGLALAPADDVAAAAHANVAAALAALPVPPEKAALDELAADYAAIYLNNSLGASPYESIWLDDDHLACQRPMFELREIYAAAGYQAVDWRSRFDDHLVMQLHYLSHVLRSAAVDGEKMANFIDEHVGYWFPDFAQRVALGCNTPFYAALAELTHVWLLRLRNLLDEIHACPLPTREQMTARIQRKLALEKAEIAPIRFMPGAQGPSW